MLRRTFRLMAPLDAGDHVLGAEHAPVTVVEYGDFQCPHCKKAVGAVKVLLARFGAQVRFAFRHFPLEGVHRHALLAAEAAECAGAQGRFWEMHDLLFERQDRLQRLYLFDLAVELGLDMSRFAADLDAEIYLHRVREHQRSGAASGVRATPTFYVNGTLLDVSYGLRALTVGVEAALRRNAGKPGVQPAAVWPPP
jgi:protein-disulfide isomerase